MMTKIKVDTKASKKEEKLRKKLERQEIIETHMNICMEKLDEGYDNLLADIGKFNYELMEMSNILSNKSSELDKYISLDDIEKIKENIKETFEFADKCFLRIARYITPGKQDSITQPLTALSKDLNKYLNNLEAVLHLSKNKNATYIVSYIFNSVQKRSEEYCRMICDDFYDNNEFFKAFEDMYYDYEERVKLYRRKLITLKLLKDYSEIENIEDQKDIQSGRLRITHSDMIDFAKSIGFEEDRQGSSTHRIFKNAKTGISVPIPAKKGRDLPQGTMSKLLKQMGYTRKDLARFLSK